MRRAGNRIRVTARLIDPWAGNELWADRFDRDLTDIFEVQDEITSLIVNLLAGRIARQHYLRVLDKSPDAIDAYDNTLKAMEHALRVSPDDNLLARRHLERAIEIDPGFARAHAILALTYVNEGNNLWVEDPSASFEAAYSAATSAVAADSRDPWSHAMLGIAQLWQRMGTDQAVASMRHALALNPNNACFRGLLAYVLSYAGAHGEALSQLKTAELQNPQHPAVFLGFRARALMLLGRYEEALPIAQRMETLMPGHSNALSFLIVCYAALGREAAARELADRLASVNPHYRLSTLRAYFPFARAQDLNVFLQSLARAGLPE